MPELPEVEVFRQFAERHAWGKPIAQVQILQPKILKSTSSEQVQRLLTGRTLTHSLRRGKYLFLKPDAPARRTSQPWMLFHFGMTGYFSQFDDPTHIQTAYGDRHTEARHIRLQLDWNCSGHFAFHEQRMFGYVQLVDDPETFLNAKQLGPDALTVPWKAFDTRLHGRKGALKPMLMDQSVLAGIGNVYADEILFQCRLHPLQAVHTLKDRQRRALHAQTLEVLQNTISVQADRKQLPATYMTHTRQPQGICPRDGQHFTVQSIGGRTTYFCNTCQPLMQAP